MVLKNPDYQIFCYLGKKDKLTQPPLGGKKKCKLCLASDPELTLAALILVDLFALSTLKSDNVQPTVPFVGVTL